MGEVKTWANQQWGKLQNQLRMQVQSYKQLKLYYM